MSYSDDWKCDQYHWRHYGRKRLQTTPVIIKTYYVFIAPNGKEVNCFKRYSYAISRGDATARDLTLVHYKGDDSVLLSELEDDGSTKPYLRTCPSVLRDMEKAEKAPSVAYKRKVGKSVSSLEHQSVLLPRNQKQVANLQARYRQRLRISHDALYNLHELSHDLENFIHKIVTYPDLVVVCGLKLMLKEVNRLLQLDSSNCNQVLSYDTTFQLGDFYVSPILFRNVLFTKSPVMPAMFLLHERKLKSTHNELMRIFAKEVSCLVHGKYQIPFVTDDEKGFDAIDDNLPKVCHLYCWNHVLKCHQIMVEASRSICCRNTCVYEQCPRPFSPED